MTNFQSRFLFFSLALVFLSHFSLKAQRIIGVKWEIPTDQRVAIGQLEQFDTLGISILEVDSQLSPLIWQKIDSLQFEVYGSLGIRFPTATTFEQPDSSLIQNIQQKASAFLSRPSVSAIGLFEYGATHSEDFFKALKPIAEQIKRKSGPKKLYYTGRNAPSELSLIDFMLSDLRLTPANIDTFSISQQQSSGGFLFSPSPRVDDLLSPFKKVIQESSASPEKPIFVHSEWLFSILEKYPQFSGSLQTLTSEADVVFPLPRENIPSPKSMMLPIILLLIVWGSIGWHYNSSPLYRKSLLRYFVAHKFFINDIFKRQIRSSLPAFAIILQNALLIAASGLAAGSMLLSTLGQEAFFHHFSSLMLLGDNLFSLFAWVLVIMITLSLLNIIWLSIAQRSISSMVQAATIYAWPLHLNFIFCTISIAVFSAGRGRLPIAIFTAIAILVFLLSFIFASLDTLRLSRSKFMHLLKTVTPYLIIWAGVFIWIFTRQQWLEVISLSLNLK